MNETEVREKRILPALTRAGWDVERQVRCEWAFTDGRVIVRGRMVTRGERKRVDYLLLWKKHLPLAVLEAKGSHLPIGGGMQQALGYAEALDVPFAISSNGDAFLFHDRTGRLPVERELALDALPSPQLPGLDSERPHDPAELNINDLTIRVTGSTGRPDFLWEIGSGANWLSYHVAAMVGLHELLLSQPGSPVPSLLVLDQPSQVYFPRTLAKYAREGDDPTIGDEDVVAVRKVFSILSTATTKIAGLQIIVLDHASEEVWGDVDLHVVEEWRGGKALVPSTWLHGGAS